ncbi:hypothetical protein [Catenovulum sediminis]|uniref:AsmA domain-containing protein n=1 Tax=Catenovulum sediminis TaxID=1740262 RepID=A0ABV1RMK4_9ALTE
MRLLRVLISAVLFLIVAFVTVDYVYDRTKLTNQLVQDALEGYPFAVNIGHVEHHFLELGQLTLKNVRWQDDFGNSLSLDEFRLNLNWQALFYGAVDIGAIAFGKLNVTVNQNGLDKLERALQKNAAANPQATSDADSQLLVERVYLQALTVAEINLDYTDIDKSLSLENVHIQLDDWQLSQIMPFDLNNLTGSLLLTLERGHYQQNTKVETISAKTQNLLVQGEISKGQLKPLLEINTIKNANSVTKLTIEATDGQAQTEASTDAASQQQSATSISSSVDEDQIAALPLDIKVKKLSLQDNHIEFTTAERFVTVDALDINLTDFLIDPSQADWLSAVQAQMNLAAKDIQLSPYHLKEFQLNLELAKRELDIKHFAFSAFDGTFESLASVTLSQPYQVDIKKVAMQNMVIELPIAQPSGSSELNSNELKNDEKVEQSGRPEASENALKQSTDSAKSEAAQANEGVDQLVAQWVASLNIQNLTLSNIDLLLVEESTQWLVAQDINLELDKITPIENGRLLRQEDIKPGHNLVMSIHNIKHLTTEIRDINLYAETIARGVKLTDSGFTMDDGAVRLNAKVSKQNNIIKVKAHSDIQKLNLARFQPYLADSKIMPEGALNADSTVDLSIDNQKQLPAGVNGTVDLTTDGFTLNGLALDKILDGFRASQETSLFDVGTFLVTGPVGMIAMQFAQLGAGAMQLKGTTVVQQIELHLDIQDSQLAVENTRVKTKDNHLGFYGQIDLPQQAFKQFKFGLLDSDGCAAIQQTLDGPFSKVRDVLFNTTSGAVTSPISNVLRKAQDTASGGCKAFFPNSTK